MLIINFASSITSSSAGPNQLARLAAIIRVAADAVGRLQRGGVREEELRGEGAEGFSREDRRRPVS